MPNRNPLPLRSVFSTVSCRVSYFLCFGSFSTPGIYFWGLGTALGGFSWVLFIWGNSLQGLHLLPRDFWARQHWESSRRHLDHWIRPSPENWNIFLWRLPGLWKMRGSGTICFTTKNTSSLSPKTPHTRPTPQPNPSYFSAADQPIRCFQRSFLKLPLAL